MKTLRLQRLCMGQEERCLAEQQGGALGGRITLDSGTPNWLITEGTIIELFQVGTGDVNEKS